MTDSDLTVSILREIRDATRSHTDELRGVRGLTGEVRGLTGEVRGLTGEVRRTNERLDVVEHTVNDAAAQIVLLGRYIKNKHETAIDDLRERVSRLEAKASG